MHLIITTNILSFRNSALNYSYMNYSQMPLQLQVFKTFDSVFPLLASSEQQYTVKKL
jgi:hypothetical protein